MGPHSVPGQHFPVSSSHLNVKQVVLGASKGGAQSPRWEMNIPGALPDPTVPPAGCICGCTGCSPKCHLLRPSGGQILAAGASPGPEAAGCCVEQALLAGAEQPRALQTPGGLRALVWPGRVAPAPPRHQRCGHGPRVSAAAGGSMGGGGGVTALCVSGSKTFSSALLQSRFDLHVQ